MKPRLVLGVDGGGTKTLALVADENGNILARGLGGASNHNAVGFAAACAALEAAIAQALSTVDKPIESLCLGLAGVGRPADRTHFLAWATDRFPKSKIQVVSDAEILLAAGAPAGPALALICGTGSIVYGRAENGELLRAGGWGYLFGDEGSGFALGAAALRAVMRAYDGRGQSTLLTALVLQRRALTDPQGLIKSIYGAEAPRAEIAALADLVEQAASQDDPVAIALLGEAARELAEAVQAVYRKLGNSPVPIVLTGSVILNDTHLAAQFHQNCQTIGLRFSATHPVPEPAIGAIRLAKMIDDL